MAFLSPALVLALYAPPTAGAAAPPVAAAPSPAPQPVAPVAVGPTVAPAPAPPVAVAPAPASGPAATPAPVAPGPAAAVVAPAAAPPVAVPPSAGLAPAPVAPAPVAPAPAPSIVEIAGERSTFVTVPADSVTVVHHVVSRPAPPAPRTPPPQSDYGVKRPFVSGYGGVSFRVSSVSKKVATMVGARGGLLLGKRLSIGGAVYKLTRRFGGPIQGPDGPLGLKMSYGGVTLGVTVIRRGRFELGVQALAGGGVACISADYKYRDDDLRCLDSVRMIVGEPEAVAYFNLLPWMRVGLNAGVRLVAREQWRSADFLLTGGYGGLNLEFGWFKRDQRAR